MRRPRSDPVTKCAGSATTAAAAATAGTAKKVELLAASYDSAAGCMIFPLQRVSFPVRRVALEVSSNHGREELTCLYRFMVHGEPFNSVVG